MRYEIEYAMGCLIISYVVSHQSNKAIIMTCLALGIRIEMKVNQSRIREESKS